MTKSEKMKLLVEIMTACRVHGYTQCQHDFQNPRTREKVDSFVVDIPSKDEVDVLYDLQ